MPRIVQARSTRLQSLADLYPDGILGATIGGRDHVHQRPRRPAPRDDGRAGDGRAARGRAAAPGPGRPDVAARQPAGPEHLHPDRHPRAVLADLQRRRGAHDRADGARAPPRARGGRGHRHPQRSRAGPARPRALRPRRDRRPRAALAADGCEGLRPGAAQPLGQAQRRAAQADAHHRQRRRRPPGPPHRRAPRRRPDRHRAALALPARLRRGRARPTRRRLRGRRHQQGRDARGDRRAAGDLRRPRQVHPGRHQPRRERRAPRAGPRDRVARPDAGVLGRPGRADLRRRRGRGHPRGDAAARLHQVLEARLQRRIRPRACTSSVASRGPTAAT